MTGVHLADKSGPAASARQVWAAMLRIFAVLAGLLVVGVALAPPAQAHAVLLEADPADGSVLTEAPAQIRLRFNEPVSPVFVGLIGPTGRPVEGLGTPRAQDNELHLVLPSGLAVGTYLLSYRVISLDSHPVGGAIVFSIGHGGTIPVGVPATSDAGWRLVSGIDRVLFYGALFMAAGGAMFAAFVGGGLNRASAAERRRLSATAGLAVAVALLGIGIEGSLSIEGSWRALFDAATWRLGLFTGLGASFSLSIAGLALLILSLRGWLSLSSRVGLIGAVVAVASLALSGHAATADPRWLTGPALACHVLAIAFWLGSLWPLWHAVRRDAASTVAFLLVRFSSLAVPAAAVLVASGGILAVVQLGSVEGLIGTGYGHRLSAKLILAASLLSLAAINRLWLTPALAAGRLDARPRLRASIAGEAALALVILAITASLGQSIPPRALALLPVGYSTSVAVSGIRAAVDVDPARPGVNRITIHLTGADAKPLAPEEVTLEFSDNAAGVEPIRRRPRAIGPGAYEYEGAEMSLAGNWKLSIGVLVSDFDRVDLDIAIPIR